MLLNVDDFAFFVWLMFGVSLLFSFVYLFNVCFVVYDLFIWICYGCYLMLLISFNFVLLDVVLYIVKLFFTVVWLLVICLLVDVDWRALRFWCFVCVFVGYAITGVVLYLLGCFGCLDFSC